ncbi:glycosyl transferase family 1 [Marispirochaeta aestuarii]|uniref:Glycosyl transferase family 1 n=1 Tax=Marispirochaeta aestuarii TaxID=1963862 RepID=A0A1Y1RX81_9SPIO|nr:glycosyltransferase family 4 protein [Marispirochaeta aestuarii]ORC34167.1 glycosyl transferase family 1 [Marispirochaeta aestuarii]
MGKNIGFMSFRISGTDGVSLETKKWAHILERMGHRCFFMAGELDTPPAVSFIAPEAHFQTGEIKEIYQECFNNQFRPPKLTKKLHMYRERLKEEIAAFIGKFSLDVLVPENTLTIPLNIPLGMAITETIAETGIPTIAHHHDFFWERKRFLRNCVWDYFNACYPPHLNSIQHVVINSSAQNQLALRTGINSTLIPNVMDYATPAPGIDDWNRDVRKVFAIDDDELLILQPTRVVQRKGIEHAIELVARLGRKAALVISHASGDEGYEYQQRVHDYADLMKIRAIFVDDLIREKREYTADGRKTYTLYDVYPFADLVTYPSIFEGFGNAFLEAIYFRRPIMVNNYSIYSHDIKPKGFEVIEMDEYLSDRIVALTREILDDPDRVGRMADKNYAIARKYYSYEMAEEALHFLLKTFFGA